MGGFSGGADEADAIDNHRVASEHVEQQNALKYLGKIERYFHCDFRILAANESKREKQPGDKDADRIQPAKERDNDRRKAVTGRYVRLQIADRPRHFDNSGKARKRAGHSEGQYDKLIGVEAREPSRLRRGANELYFK